MGIGIRYHNHKYEPEGIILNDIGISEDEHNDLKAALVCTVEGTVPLDPSCRCGITTGAQYSNVDVICPVCNEPVSIDNRDSLKPLIFLNTPIGVSRLICANFWNTMRIAFNRGSSTQGANVSILRWVTDPNYVIKLQTGRKICDYLESQGIQRGYNNFINNFDEYINIIASEKSTFNSKESVKDLLALYKKLGDKIYVDTIPFMDKITRILEKSGGNRRSDSSFASVVDSIMGVASIDNPIYSPQRREAMIARFMENYTLYWDKFLRDTVQGKHGFIRGGMFTAKGVRVSRLVLSSITDPHSHNHIEVPWIAMVCSLETPITSILLKRGLTITQVKQFIQHCTSNYNKTMDAILQKIVDDAGGFLGSTIERYPSMSSGSMLFMNACNYKKDPLDFTLSLSAIAVRTLNADFDGDYGFLEIYMDQVMKDVLEPLSYHYNCMDKTKPLTLNNIELTVPMENNLLKWKEDSDTLTPSKTEINRMVDIFG